jgi:DNA repair exonuclease SbcCD ATPase subunit
MTETQQEILSAYPQRIRQWELKLLQTKRALEEKRAGLKRMELAASLQVQADSQSEELKQSLSNAEKRGAEVTRRLAENPEYSKFIEEIKHAEFDVSLWQIERDCDSRTFWGVYAITCGVKE